MEENLEIKLFYKYKPKFHLVVASRHDTLSSPCTLAWGKVVTWRDKTCRACRTAQRDTLVARLARHAFRGVATAWTGVDMSISLFPEVVSEIDTNPEHNRLNLYTRALLLLRRPPWWNKHGSTRSSRRAGYAHVIRVVSWLDVTSQVKLGLYLRLERCVMHGLHTVDKKMAWRRQLKSLV